MSGTVAHVTHQYGYTLGNFELLSKLFTLYEFNEYEAMVGCIFS